MKVTAKDVPIGSLFRDGDNVLRRVTFRGEAIIPAPEDWVKGECIVALEDNYGFFNVIGADH